jgi:streptogramin lyase
MPTQSSSRTRGPALTGTVLALSLALAAGCASTPDPTAHRPDPPRPAAARPLDPPPSPPVRAVLERSVRVRSGVVTLAATDGALWVSGAGAVSRIDAVTGRLVARVAAPRAGDLTATATGDGSLWVTGNYEASVVYRIDPATDRVAAIIRAPGPALGIAAGAGRVWVAIDRQGPGVVLQIDPKSDRITGPPIKVGPGPGELSYGDGSLWVQNTSPASVMRIDPATGHAATVIAPAAVNYGSPVVGAVAVGLGSLWATANDHLTRYNPRTDHVIANLPIPRATEVALGAGEVWVLAEPRSTSAATFHPVKDTAELYEVDPRDNRTVGKPVPLDAEEPIAVTVTDQDVWVGDYAAETVTELRLVRRQAIIRPAATSASPRSRAEG